MTEYRNVLSVKCSEKDGKWECKINRRLSNEPREQDNQLCFSTKQETILVNNVQLKENAKVCTVQETDRDKYLTCE